MLKSRFVLFASLVCAAQAAHAAIVVTLADLKNGQLNLQGQSAPPQAPISVDGAVYGFADTKGAFKIRVQSFTSATCVISVSAGAGSTAAALGGCTPSVTPVLSGCALNMSTVPAGGSAQGTVTFTAPPASPATVTLASSNPAAASVPASVTVAAGAISAPFTVMTSSTSASAAVTISASWGGVTMSATLAVMSVNSTIVPVSVTFSPSSVSAGGTAQGTVTLSAPAPVSLSLSLSNSNPAVITTPGTVVIPAASTQGVFNATAAAGVSGSATISTSLNGVMASAVLSATSLPPATDSVTITLAELPQGSTQLKIEAVDTSATASLTAYNEVTGALLGPLANNGGGKYAGQFQTLPFAQGGPASVRVQSSQGGCAIRDVNAQAAGFSCAGF
jgi:hypothetical protein